MKYMAGIVATLALLAHVEYHNPIGEVWEGPKLPKAATSMAITVALLLPEPLPDANLALAEKELQQTFPDVAIAFRSYPDGTPASRRIRKQLGHSGGTYDLPAVVIVDADNRIRLVEPLGSGVSSELAQAFGADANYEDRSPIELVTNWLTGRKIYNADCARCHGEDGALNDYPNILRLDGIAERMDAAEILYATEASGFVNIRSYTKRDRAALVTYVLSLYKETPES